MVSILLVDDELEWMQGISRTLNSYKVAPKKSIYMATDSATARDILNSHRIDLVLLDLYLAEESGEDLLEEILLLYPQQDVVVMTGSNSTENAVSCIKKGAVDYFVKSTPVSELMANTQRVLKIRHLERENENIRKQITVRATDYPAFSCYITQSPQMFAIFDYIKLIASSPYHILITGESGVGKGLIAKLIGEIASPDKPFVSTNVAGYDELMFADALFGHVKGAYTGAEGARQGIIKQASDGVLFLDEIGDLSMQSQIKLLYLLQDREYLPLGSDKVEKTAAKFILASNQDLALKVREKTFRSDLFFRLNTHQIHLPALRNRQEDIPLLVRQFAEQTAREMSKNVPVFTERLINHMMTLHLPGNIRQLQSIISDLVIRNSEIIDIEQLNNMQSHTDFMEKSRNDEEHLANLNDEKLSTVKEMTEQLIRRAMRQSGGNQVKAAQVLGVSQPTLSRWLKRQNFE
ncbi:sigma-54-dependent transcriptional regulator [Serratia sp. L9]|uniref:sigma-54-dependent transcriptional regulator n=1 Tax=Serratia sp. L9 TaxID=3423946 RepID=UPI003D66DBC7